MAALMKQSDALALACVAERKISRHSCKRRKKTSITACRSARMDQKATTTPGKASSGEGFKGHRKALMPVSGLARLLAAASPAGNSIMDAASDRGGFRRGTLSFLHWLFLGIYSWFCLGVLVDCALGRARAGRVFLRILAWIVFVLTCVPWIAEVLSVHGGLFARGAAGECCC